MENGVRETLVAISSLYQFVFLTGQSSSLDTVSYSIENI